MAYSRHPIPKEVSQIYEDLVRAAGVDPAAPILQPPMTATEKLIAAKQGAQRKAKRRAQRQARKRTSRSHD
jgi:hypothetical protein